MPCLEFYAWIIISWLKSLWWLARKKGSEPHPEKSSLFKRPVNTTVKTCNCVDANSALEKLYKSIKLEYETRKTNTNRTKNSRCRALITTGSIPSCKTATIGYEYFVTEPCFLFPLSLRQNVTSAKRRNLYSRAG
jgi:hypothetical protein